MRILHLNKRYGVVGGMERHVADLVQWQRARGHQVDVLAIGDRFKNRVLHEDGGTIYLLPELFTYQAAVISHRFPDTLARLLGRYDILHFQYPFPMAELSYLLCGFLSKTPAIATFQGEVVPAKRFSRAYNAFARLFLARMKRIIATSPNMVETSKYLRPFKHKVTVVPLGIDPPAQGPTANVSLFPEETYPRLLFVGRFGRYKGIPYLIEAMAHCPGHLVLVGDGPIRPTLEARCRELGIGQRVTFAGVLTDDELSCLYRQADTLVLPSTDRGESFGYVTLEALATSTALVTTELGTGTSYGNVHGETGLVIPPKDPDALAKAITLMASDPDALERMKEAASQRFQRLFTLEPMCAALEAEYQAVLNDTSPH